MKKENHHRSYADTGGHYLRGMYNDAAKKICTRLFECMPVPQTCLINKRSMRRCPRTGTERIKPI